MQIYTQSILLYWWLIEKTRLQKYSAGWFYETLTLNPKLQLFNEVPRLLLRSVKQHHDGAALLITDLIVVLS